MKHALVDAFAGLQPDLDRVEWMADKNICGASSAAAEEFSRRAIPEAHCHSRSYSAAADPCDVVSRARSHSICLAVLHSNNIRSYAGGEA